MYQIAICDDDQAAGDHIRTMTELALRERCIHAVLTVYQAPAQLLDDLRQGGRRYDLYLLDILMGDENGMDLARTLRAMGECAKLVFITSSPDFWRDGYQVQASDYLLKPVDPADLSEVLHRLLKEPNTLTLRLVSGSAATVAVDSIRWAEAFDHTTQVHTATGSYTALGTLGGLAKALPGEKFFRCHRSYLVNLDCVAQVDRASLHLMDGTRIPLSRGSMHKLQKAIIRNAEDSLPLPL